MLPGGVCSADRTNLVSSPFTGGAWHVPTASRRRGLDRDRPNCSTQPAAHSRGLVESGAPVEASGAQPWVGVMPVGTPLAVRAPQTGGALAVGAPLGLKLP